MSSRGRRVPSGAKATKKKAKMTTPKLVRFNRIWWLSEVAKPGENRTSGESLEP